MTGCYQKSLNFGRVKWRRVEAEFSGGDITSNAGVVLLKRLDQRLGLTDALARALDDPRRQASCRYTLSTLLRQSIYALALGSESTVGRVERRCDRAAARAFHRALGEQFISSFKPPES